MYKYNTMENKLTVKEYNKKYYEANKLRIADMLGAKETCPLCGRKNLNHQHMPRHKRTKICERNRDLYKLTLENQRLIDI